jgi:hypothetical protein
MIIPMAVIVFHLPAPFSDMNINIPATDIAKPSNESDPTTTTYLKDYRKTILIKVIREIELLLEEEDILEGNEHISSLRQLLEYPNIKKETFEHYFKMSVSNANALFEVYPKYLLPHFVNLYSDNTPENHIVTFHLQFVGTANRHLKNALLSNQKPAAVTPTAILRRPTQQQSQQTIDHRIDQPVQNNPSPSLNPIDNNEEPQEYESLSPAFQHLNGIRPINQSNQLNESIATPSIQQPRRVSFSANTNIDDTAQQPNEEQKPQMTVNTPWDSFQRTPYISSPQQFIQSQVARQQNEAPRYSDTTSWTRARFNPDDADSVINSATGHFRPWQADRPEYGPTTCYPVQVNEVYMIRDLFLSSFRSGPAVSGFTRFEPKRLNLFKDAFPTFGPDDVGQFLYWHNDLVEHCITYGVFVPPIHTLRPEQYLGIWFPDIPQCVQLDTQKYFSHLITGCLRNKMQASMRQEHPTIANIILHGSRNGYKILYLLAKQAGKHPLLIRYPFDPPEPIQTADTTLEQYLTNWTQYLQHRLLDGTIYCDRYFLQQFQRNLYPTFQQKLGPKIEQAVDKIDISRPLPRSFGPDELFQQIEDFAEFVRLPNIMLKTPRNAFQQTSAVHAVQNQSVHHIDVDSEIDLPAIIAAINNTSASNCFLCDATDHRMAQCSIYQRLQNNPRAITALLRNLKPQQQNRNRGNRHGGGPPRHIRQIDQSTETTLHEVGEGRLSPTTLAGEGTLTIKSDDDPIITQEITFEEPLSDFV